MSDGGGDVFCKTRLQQSLQKKSRGSLSSSLDADDILSRGI